MSGRWFLTCALVCALAGVVGAEPEEMTAEEAPVTKPRP